ncbi:MULTISPECIES: phytoene desaturase family protein [Arthrobacter]|uniref:Phytoene desaturase n=1 Tax=Arthrobacter sunyaminii TaxID=2816859 RepID=A0A975S5F4_9MICC|nr:MULTISPECIES: phytoene desaturase family protein [Arthrobacter]MBO0897320.1 phytoene desaturase [Arthrobacter sunyaminii]MBO0908757.1 phytoene desaturase [Arthrobacter sunyaminii]QWQ35726.1 phytoene desaturase [Arthrobacter sunyaminii]
MTRRTASAPPRTAVVIGGGITGLATAALLAREGLRVTVLEQQSVPGGRTGTWQSAGFSFDTGPSWYLMPEVFDHFFRLMGTSAEEQLDLVQLDPGYRVIFEGSGEPVDIAATRAENVKLFESLEPGAGAKLEKYLDSAVDVYDMAKKRFLYSTFASFLPLLRPDVLKRGPRLAQLLLQPLSSFVAQKFTDPRIRQILGYPAVFLGSSPFTTPSMYHLMSRLDLADGVLYPMGGFTRLISVIADLATAEGVTIRTDATVTRIRTTDPEPAGRLSRFRRSPGVRATGVEYTNVAGQALVLDADLVVSAADLHHTETSLLPRNLQTYPERYWKNRIPGPGGLLLHLGVRGTLPSLAHHTLLFTKDWEENFGKIFGKETSVPDPASLYVCRPSATDPDAAPDGYENIFVLVPVPSDPALGAGGMDGSGDERIERMADAVIAQISDWANIPDLAERITVRRTVGPQDFVQDLNSWRGTLLGPAHVLKQSAFFRGSNASRKVDGLLYAGGSTLPGIGLPMCLISAELVLKRLRGDTSTEELPVPSGHGDRAPGGRG